jgi:arylsulfatase A-like enzyme
MNYLSWEYQLIHDILQKKRVLQLAEKSFLLDRYDADIKQMDHGIGELMVTLKKLDAYDNTLIIITADHGESFGEHGMMTHPPVLYEDLVKIPLIVKYPKQKEKIGRYAGPVSIVDIMPEILKTLKIEIPQDIQGVPFYQENHKIFAEKQKDRAWKWTAYNFEERSLIALYDGDYKFIWASNQQHELYNIAEDPLEITNLVSKRPDIVDTMESAVQDYLRTAESDGKAAHSVTPVTKEVSEALKALGYVQ